MPGEDHKEEEEDNGRQLPHPLQQGVAIDKHDAGGHQKHGENLVILTIRLFHNKRHRDKIQISLQIEKPSDVHAGQIDIPLRRGYLQILNRLEQIVPGE